MEQKSWPIFNWDLDALALSFNHFVELLDGRRVAGVF
jgi:hypothetical protein